MAVQFQPSFGVQQKFERLTFQYESQVSVESSMSSCPSTPSTPTSPIDFEIKIATEKDSQSILEFLRTFFFRDEPLNLSLGLITDEHPICEDLEKFAMKDIVTGPTLIAVYNDKLIGVCINGVLEKEKLEKEEPFPISDKQFGKITGLLEYVGKESNPFKKYPGCNKAMTVKIISVDGAYRGKGIAKDLIAKTRQISKELGCGFITVDCTSHFTACAVKRLGFELHYTLNYADYKVDGEVVLKPAPPHKAVTVYTQKIE